MTAARSTFLVALISVLAAGLGGAPAIYAQERDASVPPSGVLRVQLGAELLSLEGRFGEAGRESIFAPWAWPLTAERIPRVGTLAERISALMADTGQPAGPDLLADISLGALESEGRADRREMPVTLELGLPAGLSVGARGALVRRETVVHGARVVGGTLGANPDPAGNEALLRQVGEAHAPLGASDLLPLAGTAAGDALQARVRDATGQELSLPEEPADAALLAGVLAADGMAAGPLRPAGESYGPGDSEIFARLRIPGGLSPETAPPAEGLAWRAAAGAALLLPTGRLGPEAAGHHLIPRGGRSGVRLEGAGEVFLPLRVRVASELRWTLFAEEDRAPAAGPVPPPADARWRPGSMLELSLLPRVQLHPAIGLVAGYRLTARAEGEIGGEIRGDAFSGTRHDGVLGITFRAAEGGVPVARWPLDAGLALRRSLGGTAGGWDIRGLDAWVRVHAPVWGR